MALVEFLELLVLFRVSLVRTGHRNISPNFGELAICDLRQERKGLNQHA